jgi:hypothetical protein
LMIAVIVPNPCSGFRTLQAVFGNNPCMRRNQVSSHAGRGAMQ